MKYRSWIKGAAALALCWPGLASAQEDSPDTQSREQDRREQDEDSVESIFVTATKTGETNLQDTPIAITAVTSDVIDSTGIDDIRDLTNITPGLVITSNGSFAQVYIRGVGSNNIFAGSDPSSTLHIDGVYIARPVGYLNNFLDVERIEVLRGPQGTLYGRNSVGGTINVISRRPTNEFRARGQLTIGNYDLFRVEGYVSAPIVEDRAAFSVAAMRSRRDGFIENIFPGGRDLDDEDVSAVRGQLRLTPASNFEFLIRGDYLETDETGWGTTKLLEPTTDALSNSTLGDLRRVAHNSRGFSNRRIRGLSGEAVWDLDDHLTLTSLTAYRDSLLDSLSDTDGSSLLIRTTSQFEEQHQWSQELNLAGRYGRHSFVVGLYGFAEEMEADATVTNFVPGVAGNPNPTVETESWAIFGQANFFLTDELSVTAGARYTEETKDFSQNFTVRSVATGLPLPGFPRTYDISGNYSAFTPRLGVEYRPIDNIMLYASATRGFKSGGFNFASQNPVQGYSPEYLWSYEAGIKTDLLDRRLRLNATAFRYDYTDLQVQSFLTPGVIDITNASDARVTGVEVEAVARPISGLEVGGFIAYLDAVYRNYPDALAPGNIPFDASGRRINSSPEWSYNAYAQHRFELGNAGSITGRIDFSWRGRQYFTPENNAIETQAGYGLLNANLGWTSPDRHWQVVAFARNLTNEEYVTTTATFTGVVSGRTGEPRVLGLRLILDY